MSWSCLPDRWAGCSTACTCRCWFHFTLPFRLMLWVLGCMTRIEHRSSIEHHTSQHMHRNTCVHSRFNNKFCSGDAGVEKPEPV